MKVISKYILLGFCLLLFKAEAPETSFDYLILGGTVFDGESAEPRNIDIGIQGDRVTALGDLKNRPAKQKIDASGLMVQPGIIDAHTHSDLTALKDTNFEHALRQGVTTIITGNCGMSGFPITDQNAADSRAIWAHEGVTVAEDYRAGDFEDFHALLTEKGMSLNVAPMVGHGNIRTEIVGLKTGALSDEEIEREV